MTAPLLDRPTSARVTPRTPSATWPAVAEPVVEPGDEGASRQLELALTDLTEVLGVYPFRAAMPVCAHCVSEDDLRTLGRHPQRIPTPLLDRFVTKSLITWGAEPDLKRLLPEILDRAFAGRLGAPEPLVGARMRRAGWPDWPAAEAPAVRRALRAAWLTTLSTGPGPGRPPAMSRLGLIVTAEDDLSPYLDLWEDRLEAPGDPTARLHAVLHLADLLAPLAGGGRRRLARSFPLARRGVVGQLDQWLRLPVVIRRLAHAADALEHTPQGALVSQARVGLSRLRTER